MTQLLNDKKPQTNMPAMSADENGPVTQPADINLLIVDDEADFRESACRYFARFGFRVDQAEDGEEALNVSVNKKFDVVVLDIHMPGMNGKKLRPCRHCQTPVGFWRFRS